MASNLIAVLQAVTSELDTEKTAITETLDIIDIDTAQDEDLDRIGEIVGEPPRAKNEVGDYIIDNVIYRANIKIRIELNMSNGERESVIKAVKRYTGASSVEVQENIASMIVNVFGTVTQDNMQQIKDIVAAGVGLYVIRISETPFQYGTGFGYGVGEYADLITFKESK